MASWRSSPVMGVIAVLAIVIAAFLIYRQLTSSKVAGGASLSRNEYMGEIAAGEAKKLVTSGGVLLWTPASEEGKAFATGFNKKSEGLTPKPVEMPLPKGNTPADMAEAPLKALNAAIAAAGDIKGIVAYHAAPIDPPTLDAKTVAKFVELIGKTKTVIVGDVELMSDKNPFMPLIKSGNLVIIADKPIPPKLSKEPKKIGADEYFKAYKVIVDKSSIDGYIKEMNTMMGKK